MKIPFKVETKFYFTFKKDQCYSIMSPSVMIQLKPLNISLFVLVFFFSIEIDKKGNISYGK